MTIENKAPPGTQAWDAVESAKADVSRLKREHEDAVRKLAASNRELTRELHQARADRDALEAECLMRVRSLRAQLTGLDSTLAYRAQEIARLTSELDAVRALLKTTDEQATRFVSERNGARDQLRAAEQERDELATKLEAGPPWIADAAEAIGLKGQALTWTQVLSEIRDLKRRADDNGCRNELRAQIIALRNELNSERAEVERIDILRREAVAEEGKLRAQLEHRLVTRDDTTCPQCGVQVLYTEHAGAGTHIECGGVTHRGCRARLVKRSGIVTWFEPAEQPSTPESADDAEPSVADVAEARGIDANGSPVEGGGA